MSEVIKPQRWTHLAFYAVFGTITLLLIWYYLSNTLIHYTTNQQFPINSFQRFPLTFLIFPAELFSALFALYFVYVLFTDRYRDEPPALLPNRARTRVAVLLPVYHEPREIVERTVIACKELVWPGGVTIYLLDDSTDTESKKEMDALARKYGCKVVRRPDRAGYKAGNLNYAVANAVTEEYFVILDSDQAPMPGFLQKTMDHFSDADVGFVQTPQYFINDDTPLRRASKVGTNIFYHSQCVSKARDGAMPFCGTNAVIRTAAFRAVNGFSYYTATEDIELGLRLNDAGYRGAYVPEVLVLGYAPPDYPAYASQQYRWANGNLAIFRESWPKIFSGRFSLRHQIHTIFTLGWWFIGFVTLIYILVPLLALLLGTGTHHTWLPTALLILLYFNVVLGIGMIYVALHNRLDSDKVTIGDAILQYVLITNSVFIFAKAAFNAMFGRYIGFVRTDKKGSSTGWRHIWPNLLLAAICLGFSLYALYYAMRASDIQQLRTYLPISIWLLFYGLVLGASILFVGDPEKLAARAEASKRRATGSGVRSNPRGVRS